MLSRSVLSLSLTAAVAATFAAAQSSNGYVLGGAGTYSSKLITQAAIEVGEMVFGKGIGAGGEVGFIAGHDSFGFLSLNGY